MKKLLSLCAAALFAVSAPAFQPDWNSVKIKRTESNIWLGTPGSIQVSPKGATNLVKIEIQDGKLIVDTREFYEQNPKGEIVLRSPVSKYVPGENSFFSVEMSAQPAQSFRFFFEGGATKKGKPEHYWKEKRCLAPQTPQEFRFEQKLPESLANLSLRLDFSAPAIYSLGKCVFGKVEAPKIDSTKEQIVNGGAERGLYGTAYADIRNLGSTKDGKYYDYLGKAYSGTLKLETDSTEFYSGKRSFKVTTPPNSYNLLFFHPVPAIPDEPITLSVMMKAAKPTTVSINLFPHIGSTYVKNVTVGTQWKRYTLSVPAFGKPAPGVSIIGNPGSSFGAAHKLVFPRFDFQPDAVVWLDDVSCRLAKDSVFQDDSSVWISGVLNKNTTYYFPNEPVSANLRFESSNGNIKTTNMSWRVEDFFGKTIASSPARTLNLPALEKINITIPETVRGRMTLIVSSDVNGKVDEHVLPFGKIDRPGALLPRFGMNIDGSSHNVKDEILYLKDFRQGAVRVWKSKDGHGFDDVVLFHNAGIYTLFCLDFILDGKQKFFLPKDYTNWKKYLTEKVRSVKGKIDAYEILNEPNIWSGRSQNPDPQNLNVVDAEAVAECISACAEVIRKEDPKAKIAGPTPCGTNVVWIETVLGKKGVAEKLDIITEHPYRQLPELPDYGEDLQGMRKMTKQFKRDYPIYGTEAGRVYPSAYPDNRITDFARCSAARDIRNALVGFANGLDKYFHFSMGGGIVGTAWTSIVPGNGENNCTMIPGAYLYAARAAADRIENGIPAGQVKLGVNYRCYIFDLGNKRIATLWKWNGEPETIEFAETFRAWDFMGSRIDNKKFRLDEFPIYLESNLTASELAKRISSAKLNITEKAFRSSFKVTGKNSFIVEIRNLTAKPLSGKVAVLSGGVVEGNTNAEFSEIPAESVKTVSFRTKRAISIVPQEIKIDVEVPSLKQRETLAAPLRAILVPHAKKEIKIDGDLSDWNGVEPVILTSRNAVRTKKWNDNDEKIKVEFRSQWNSNRLYLAFTVIKDTFNPEDTLGEGATWKGDGIQFAFDTIMNAPKNTAGYQDDDFEYSFSQYKGEPLLMRLAASASTYDSLAKPLGKTDQAEYAIRREKGRVIYEIALPPVSISPFQLLPGSATRFNFIVNLNNGKERIGWLELTPGIGQQPKRPAEFMDFILQK